MGCGVCNWPENRQDKCAFPSAALHYHMIVDSQSSLIPICHAHQALLSYLINFSQQASERGTSADPGGTNTQNSFASKPISDQQYGSR